MPERRITPDGLRELFAQHSSSAMLGLVSFYHEDGSKYVGLVGNNENITHQGVEYIGIEFELVLPDNDEERVPTMKMKISNVTQDMIDLLRSVQEAPDVAVEVIRVSPDMSTHNELGPMYFSLLQSDISTEQIELSIGYTDDLLNSPATSQIFNPGTSPALFSS